MSGPASLPHDRATPSRTVRLLAVVAGVLALFALQSLRAVAMPLALGLAFAVLAWPVHDRVARHTREGVGVLAAVLAIVVVLAAVISLLGWSADQLVDAGRERQDKVAELRTRAGAAARRIGIELPGSGGGASSGAAPTAQPSGQRRATGQSPSTSSDASSSGGGGGSLAQRLGHTLYEVVGSLALAVGFAALALAEVNDAARRIRRRFAPERAERILEIAREVAHAVRRYFAVKTLTSLITGAATGLFALAVGLDLAGVWALLAFLLEYVPSVGSVIAIVPPAVFAFLQFDGLVRPLLTALGFVVLQLTLGNFVDPRIEGRVMSVSPLVVLLSIVFWAWVWGPFGALLGVPMTVALTIVCRHFDGTRWIWAVLSEEKE